MKTLFLFALASFCNGRAIKFPNPPLGNKSWLGNRRSYDLKATSCLSFIEWVSIELPNFLAKEAATGCSKKNQA